MNKNLHYQERENDVVGGLDNKYMTIYCEKKTVEILFSSSYRSNQATIQPIKIYRTKLLNESFMKSTLEILLTIV